jgi:hypothetical protein
MRENKQFASLDTPDKRSALEAEVTRLAALRGKNNLEFPPSDMVDILVALKVYQDADPIGFTHAGYIVFGKAGVPWGLLGHVGRSSPTNGWSRVWEIHSPHIVKTKGDKFLSRSRTVSGIINFVRRLKPCTLEEMFQSQSKAENAVKNFDHGASSYVWDTTSDLRRMIFNYLKAIKDGETPVMPEELEEWYRRVKDEESRVQREVAHKKNVIDTFRKKSIIIEKVPYTCDFPIIVREMSLPYADLPKFSEPQFYRNIEEMTQYPHIVGLYNLKRLVYSDQDFFELMSKVRGYSKADNIFSMVSGGGIMSTHVLIFPGEFMEEKTAAVPTAQSAPTKSDLSFDNIFSVDI